MRIGIPRFAAHDLYHYVLVQPWSIFFAILVALYLCANCGFAILYLLQPGGIAEARRGSWADAFFFSIETMATVGYGVMHPATLYAHLLVVIEILFGVLAVPVATGLTIVKFTRPSARVLFSRVAVITPFDGVPTLMFRLANIRGNQILEARIKVTILRNERSLEGYVIRRLVDLPLVRDSNPMFALSWSVMHRLDESSPLAAIGGDWWASDDLLILAIVTGIDGTSSATVHARHGWRAGDLQRDHVFEDILSVDADGQDFIDYRRFHATRAATA